MYCRSRKIPVGVAAGGMIMPSSGFAIPRSDAVRYNGIVILPRVTRNNTFRPWTLYFANA
jgi:hypothetical protein